MDTQKILKTTPLIFILLSAPAAIAAPLMYVDDSSGRLATVDVATGGVNVIGTMGEVMTDIAFSPTGDLYGVSFTGLYSINSSTAATTLIGNLGIGGANALVFSSSGTLYAASNSSNSLYSVNTATGAATSLGNIGYASGGDLAFHNGSFYLASSNNQLVKIDLSNLANTTAVGSFGVSGVYGLASGDNNVLYGVAGTSVYSVDTLTGLASNPISYSGQGLGTAYGQSFFAEATPEVPVPAAAWLFGSGLIGMAGLSRKRKSNE